MLLTISDAAKRLSLSDQTVRKYVKEGFLPSVQFGKRGRPSADGKGGANQRIDSSELEAFIVRHERNCSRQRAEDNHTTTQAKLLYSHRFVGTEERHPWSPENVARTRA